MTNDPRPGERDASAARSCSSAIRERAGASGDVRFVVVRPADAAAPRQRHLRRGRARRRAGARRPARSRSCATRASTAIGEVGDADPFNADDGRDRRAAGSTRSSSRRCPATSSGWLRRDLIERLAGRHRPAGRARRRRPRQRGPAVRRHARASPTRRVASAELRRARCKAARPSERPHLLHRRRPAGGRRRARARERARARLRQLLDRAARATGLVAAGMIGDPDPYTATMNALQFFHVDDDRHLDAARRRARAGCATT